MKHLKESLVLEELSDFLFEGIVLTDKEGYILSFNQSFNDFFPKLTTSDLLNKRIMDFTISKDLDNFFRHPQEMRNIPISIGMYQLLANFTVLEGNTVLMCLKNITKIQQLVKEMKDMETQVRLFQRILDTLDEGVCSIDNEHRITLYNKKMGELDSKEPSSVIGKQYSSIFKDATSSTTPLLHSLSTERKLTQNEAFFSDAGKRYIVKKVSEPLFLGNQKAGAVSIVKDFSEAASMTKIIFQKKNEESSELSANTEKPTLPPIIQSSKAMQKLIQQAQLAAASSTNLFIHGENGVGKSLIADYIIKQTKITDDKINKINCAAIPPLLLEELLFGTDQFPGLLEQNFDGMILFDHIDEMPLSLQKRLLDLIKYEKFYRLQDCINVPLKVRFIALLDEQPSISLKKGKLLEDLFYVLSGITLNIPPLRERKEDISSLVTCFLEGKNEPGSDTTFHISSDALNLLSVYDYPGNILQLKHILEGAKSLAKNSRKISSEHLPPYLTFSKQIEREEVGLHESLSTLPLTEQVESFEKNLITNMLKTTNFHITQAADKLGVSRQSLNYKIRKYEIEISREDE